MLHKVISTAHTHARLSNKDIFSCELLARPNVDHPGLMKVLLLIDHLDYEHAPYLSKIFTGYLSKNLPKEQIDVVLDMHNIIYIDSAGIGGLLNIYGILKDHKCFLYLEQVLPPVEKILERVNLKNAGSVLRYVDSAQELLPRYQDRKRSLMPVFQAIFI